MSKGSQFEREFCKRLSLWWSEMADDGIFWRTSNSGGRATARGKAKTRYQHGDVTFTDPSGIPFLDMFTVELKRGYKDVSVLNLLDKRPQHKMQTLEEFFVQAITSHEAEGSQTWLLVTRKNQREDVVWFEKSFYKLIKKHLRDVPIILTRTLLRRKTRAERRKEKPRNICGIRLNDFFERIGSQEIRDLVEMLQRN